MERREAVALLKELMDRNLAQPSFVALKENKHGKFDLILKGNCDTIALKKFSAEKNLIMQEDKEKGYCVIHKPQ